jgi:hypothetical protein
MTSELVPDYPYALRELLAHARRLMDLLAKHERRASPYDSGGAWLIGRASELRCVIALVAMDWHKGLLSSDAAARKLGRHVRDLHDGLAIYLDIGRPACCRESQETTPGVGLA